MILSVIIVNYNVKHFLRKCLLSVLEATDGDSTEIWVIDNHSSDGSIPFLTPLFPQVRFISNDHNPGFGKACNQGLARASGKYILFLNPDTVISREALQQCFQHLEQNSLTGAVGVRMIDGNGRFLKESKRSLPGVLSSAFKLFGLSKLYPRSKYFSKYNLGHLDENQNHEVDVLSGAFMMIKKEVLDKTGGFDEDFFMYGEDVDLSYRIQKAGYKNYYVGEVSIIHFKGESTNKKSVAYIKNFYGAMLIFVDKHYKGPGKLLWKLFIYFGIGCKAAISTLQLAVKK